MTIATSTYITRTIYKQNFTFAKIWNYAQNFSYDGTFCKIAESWFYNKFTLAYTQEHP